MDDGRNAQIVGTHQRRPAGETAHTNHHIGLEAFQDGDGMVDTARELQRQQKRLDFLGEAADPQAFNRVASLGHTFHLHAAFGTDKQDVGLGKSPFQGIGNGDGGKDVAASATTTNHDFKVLIHSPLSL